MWLSIVDHGSSNHVLMLKPGPESLSHGPLIITQPWSPLLPSPLQVHWMHFPRCPL
ncbi:hypothetical protein V8C44DRAFT_317216 [Trichoderma aethiopicum]